MRSFQVNTNIITHVTMAGMLIISAVFSYILYDENANLKRLAADLAVNAADNDRKVSVNDLALARENGKTDGKIEALLMMQNVTQPIDQAFAEKIISIAESPKPDNFENNPSFLSLLSQAAYHKGLHTGLESSAKDVDENYEKGYHKALEDFTCPATGNILVPNSEKKLDIPVKKPK